MISQRQLFLNHIAQTSPTPLGIEISKARGCYIFSTDNKKYLDLIAGISVSALGHHHPKVIRAIQKQLKKYLHVMVYGELVNSPQVLLAKKLVSILQERLDQVYFTNSGSEANDGAIKLAKRYTGRHEIISCKNAYHGSSMGVLSIIGDEYFKNNYRPLIPGNRQIRFNNFDDLSKISCKTAAVIIEPIQGEAGYIPAEKDWLIAVRDKCSEMKCLLIFDEVQSGMGRTGSFFAHQSYGIVPDIVTIAKALGAGLPLGAFISKKEIMQAFTENPVLGNITTFGGNPLACAASLAAVKEIELNVMAHISEKEVLFRRYLNHPKIMKVSGKGLMLAIEFENEKINKLIIDKCIQRGLFLDWFLFNDKSIRVSPPLIISDHQIKKACTIILESINEVYQTN